MRQLGAIVATLLQGGSVLYLSGPIGAGKTTLTQGLLAAAGIEEAVTSPTFSLVESYQTTARAMPAQIWHFDLYRLEQPEELEFIGARDCFNAHDAVIVEWPERGFGFLPTPDIHIRIDFVNDSGRNKDALTKDAVTDVSEVEAVDVEHARIQDKGAGATIAGDGQSLIRMKTDFETSVRMNSADTESVLSPRQVTVILNK